MPSNTITILPVPWTHPDAIYLRALQRTEITSLGGQEPGTPPSAADVPVFVVAYRGTIPVGCGGLRPLSRAGADAHANAAELKRMFVDPAHRGRVGGLPGAGKSVAGMILERLENEARARGWGLLVLETGTFLANARRFYERCGFVECELFGEYVGADRSVCYEKRL